MTSKDSVFFYKQADEPIEDIDDPETPHLPSDQPKQEMP